MIAQTTNATQKSIIILVVVVMTVFFWMAKNDGVSHQSLNSAVTETSKESNSKVHDALHESKDIRNKSTITGKKLPVLESLEMQNLTSTTMTSFHNLSTLTKGATAENTDNATLTANRGTAPDMLNNAEDAPIKNETISTTWRMQNKSLVVNDTHKTLIEEMNSSIISCLWSPNSSHACLNLLNHRLPPKPQRRHWFFFGDSTMGRLWMYPGIGKLLLQSPKETCKGCYSTTAPTRCQSNAALGLSIKKNWSWVPPDPILEGPKLLFARESPHCLECSSCRSSYLRCASPCPRPYGGYLSMDFARDVKLQSQEHNTTQENLLLFLQQWIVTENATDHHPICVINVGIHDISLNVTDKTFFKNILWMFQLFQSVCGHIVWIHTTAPQTESKNQKTPRFQVWNDGVLRLLEQGPDTLRQKASVIDVFEASKKYPHADNVHLQREWYVDLGKLFLTMM